MFDCPHMFGCPHMLDGPLYVWMPPCLGHPPVCLDVLHMFISCMFGCPQIYGASKGMRAIQTYGGVQTYMGHPNVWGGNGHTLSLTKHAFFLLYMYSRHPNIFQTYTGASRHMECPNLQETSNIGVPKLTAGSPNIGASKHTGGASKYMGVSKHMGHPT